MPDTRTPYVYKDRAGSPVFRVIRVTKDGGGKDFFIQHRNGIGWKAGTNGGTPPPYHLPEVIQGVSTGKTIYIVEGEKDADSGSTHGIIATCNFGGAGKWTDDHSKWLRGAERIVIVWDLDEKGAKHAWQVHESLKRLDIGPVLFRCAAAGKDLTDHMAEGLTLNELIKRKPPTEFEKKAAPEPIGDPDLPVAFKYIIEKLKARPEGDLSNHQYNAICPAHDDHSPSLSISIDDKRGRILLICRAGCEFEDVVAALGLTPSELRWVTEESFDWKVDQEVVRKEIRAEAEIRFQTKYAGNEFKIDLFDNSTGVDELALPDDEAPYMIEGLFLKNSRGMLVAEAKSGKTRFCLTLCKALCDEEPFLGRQVLMPEGGRVLYLNGEMHEGLFRSWFRAAEFKQPDRFIPKHFNGQSFPFWREDYRERLADWLAVRKVALIIFDTQTVFMRGMVSSENENFEVSRWQQAVDDLRRASDDLISVLVVHHMGRQEAMQARGASSMDGWPESLWYIRKVRTDEDKGEIVSQSAPRTFYATGRTPDFAPVELAYNPDTGLYTYEGISASEGRKLARFEALVDGMREFEAREGRHLKSSEARALTGVKTERQGEMLEEAVGRGLISRTREGRIVWYSLP